MVSHSKTWRLELWHYGTERPSSCSDRRHTAPLWVCRSIVVEVSMRALFLSSSFRHVGDGMYFSWTAGTQTSDSWKIRIADDRHDHWTSRISKWINMACNTYFLHNPASITIACIWFCKICSARYAFRYIYQHMHHKLQLNKIVLYCIMLLLYLVSATLIFIRVSLMHLERICTT